MTRRPTTGPIVPLPPPEAVCTNTTVHDPTCRCGVTGAKTYPPETGGTPRRAPGPRSERWVYAENARYRRTLNRAAVELTRCEHTDNISADEVIERIRAILRGANS